MARWEPLIPPRDNMIPVTVTFYGDVGFDRSYINVIDFSNETERSNYFDERILKTVQNCAYNKPLNSRGIVLVILHLRQLHADRCHGVDLQFAAFKDGDCTLADIGADADDWPRADDQS